MDATTAMLIVVLFSFVLLGVAHIRTLNINRRWENINETHVATNQELLSVVAWYRQRFDDVIPKEPTDKMVQASIRAVTPFTFDHRLIPADRENAIRSILRAALAVTPLIIEINS